MIIISIAVNILKKQTFYHHKYLKFLYKNYRNSLSRRGDFKDEEGWIDYCPGAYMIVNLERML